ncbi:MAG: hypothetical protein JNM88_05970 [Chitinophagaceae bacterium]|nr:hypothetical protein [Chitinophagaceae bacterium]
MEMQSRTCCWIKFGNLEFGHISLEFVFISLEFGNRTPSVFMPRKNFRHENYPAAVHYLPASASLYTGIHDEVSVTAHPYSGKRAAYFFSAFGKSITVDEYFIYASTHTGR